MKGGARRGGPLGLRAGQEHRARQPGIAKSGSERAGARLRHRHHMAPSISMWPEGHSGWREKERGQKRACTLPSSWGRVHPSADPRKQGGGAKKRGQGKRGGGGFRSRSRNGRSPCRKEQRRGGAGKLPPGAAGPAGLSAPAPLGLVALAGRRGPSSLLLHSASLAQHPAGPGPPAAPSAGSGVPSLPWG